MKKVPFELLLQIFTYLSADDILHLLCTCSSYHALIKDESIWRELCSRYGVHDLSSSGFHNHTSFFTVYTELLHAYGPLLGLWASDAMFQGNILQFRIVEESKEVGWEGIVGEVWKFSCRGWTDASINIPTSPAYVDCMRIELLAPNSSGYSQPFTPSTPKSSKIGRAHV